MNDLKLYFYTKYVNYKLTMSDILLMEKTHTGRKIEYGLIDKLILKNLKKSYLEMFQPLELIGTENLKNHLSKIGTILKQFELSKNEEKALEFFINQYKVNEEEIFQLCCMNINDTLRTKI